MRTYLRCIALVAVCSAVGFANASVTTTVYGSWNTADDGSPFANPIGTFMSPAEDYGTSTGFNWHPYGQGAFGAQTVGTLNLAAGYYAFGTTSDDGSSLTIDGTQTEDNGGAHGPQTILGAVTFYSGGAHPFFTNFYEDFGGASGIDLVYQTFDANGSATSGVNVVPASMLTPSPAALLPFLVGLAMRRRTRR